MNYLVTNFEILHLVSALKEKTGMTNYQLFLNSLLGISPETIDSQIVASRTKNIELEK